jgi:hypothetical protein
MAYLETAPSAEAWLKHVARWREGGESVPDYCREHGLDVGAMRYQIRRTPAPTTPTIRLARVERVPPPTAACEGAVVIELGPVRIRVERGVDPGTLTTVLTALGVRR